jgi:hypothetical protein
MQQAASTAANEYHEPNFFKNLILYSPQIIFIICVFLSKGTENNISHDEDVKPVDKSWDYLIYAKLSLFANYTTMALYAVGMMLLKNNTVSSLFEMILRVNVKNFPAFSENESKMVLITVLIITYIIGISCIPISCTMKALNDKLKRRNKIWVVILLFIPVINIVVFFKITKSIIAPSGESS